MNKDERFTRNKKALATKQRRDDASKVVSPAGLSLIERESAASLQKNRDELNENRH